MDWGCEILPTFWCRTLMIPQRTILIFNISIKRKSNAQTATQTRKLHMKHCLFRDLVVSKFASNLICQRHIPPTEPFHDVCNRNMYCCRNSECTKLQFFFQRNSPPPPWEETPHGGLWPPSTLHIFLVPTPMFHDTTGLKQIIFRVTLSD